MKYTLLILISIISISLSAQMLSGTYTIGTNGNFSSITQAVDTLMAKGVNGPVTMNIQAGVYNEHINIGTISGTSATNTITFQSANGDSTSVIITHTAQQNFFTTLTINSNFITINSISINISTQPSYNSGIAITLSANNVVISNCALSCNSSINNGYLLYAEKIDNSIIHNNTFSGKYRHGIYYFPNFFTSYNNTIENNLFYGLPSTLNPSHDIYMLNQNNVSVKNNTTDNDDIRLVYIGGNSIVQNNIIGGTFALKEFIGSSTTHALISNNFILNKNRTTSNNNPAIMLWGSYINFYNNSISDSAVSLSSNIIQVMNSSNCNIKNNIFHDKAYGVLFFYDTGNSNIVSDYNDYYTGGYYGKTASGGPTTSLSAWKTLSGMEANSINIDPGFFSSTDLHISNPAMDGSGISLAAVTDDIDGDPRPANPDMGADESNFSLIDAGVISLQHNTYLPDSVCGYTLVDSISISIKNYGVNTINFSTDSMLITLNISGPINSIYQTYINSGSLQKDSIGEYLISPTLNVAIGGEYTLNAAISIASDSNAYNDQSSSYQIINYKIENFPFVQDFENFVMTQSNNYNNDFKEGWWKTTNFSYTHMMFYTTFRVGMSSYPYYATRPAYDHTTLSPNGHWIYSYSTTYDRSTAKMWSPCVNFTNVSNPVMTFWYHMYGAALVKDTLHIDVYNGVNWDLGVYSIGGQHQASSQAPWQQATVNLSAYSNSEVIIRFRVKHDTTVSQFIAIDDVAIDAMPQVALGNDTAICAGDTLTLGYAPSAGYTYQWKENLQGIIVGQGSYYDVSQAGVYIYKATNSMNISAYDTIVVSVKQLPNPYLGSDTIICDTTSIVLITQQAYLSYIWQDSSTNNSFTVNSTTGNGNYWVKVQDYNHCWNADTITVTLDTCISIYNPNNNTLVFKIYPNPSHEYFYIQSQNIQGKFSLQLFDLLGRQVIYKELYFDKGEQIRIKTNKLEEGVYFIKLQGKKGIFTKKILIY